MIIILILLFSILVIFFRCFKYIESFNNSVNILPIWRYKTSEFNKKILNDKDISIKKYNFSTPIIYSKKISINNLINNLNSNQIGFAYSGLVKKLINNYKKDRDLTRLCNDIYLDCNNDILTINNCKFNLNQVIKTKFRNYIFNGSCSMEDNFGNKNINIDIKNKIDNGIYIINKWSDQYWHFLIETLPSILKIKNYNKYKIIMNQEMRNKKYILEILNILGISSNNIIYNNGEASKLILGTPERCGNPSNYALQLLRKTLIENLNIKKNKELVILIKRNHIRSLKNFDQLELKVRKYFQNRNIDILVHDDKKLPSIKEQLLYFSRASTIFAPHGAGLSNMIVSKNSCNIIEIFEKKNYNLCYFYTSIRLGYNYFSLDCINQIVNLEEVENILNIIY